MTTCCIYYLPIPVYRTSEITIDKKVAIAPPMYRLGGTQSVKPYHLTGSTGEFVLLVGQITWYIYTSKCHRNITPSLLQSSNLQS